MSKSVFEEALDSGMRSILVLKENFGSLQLEITWHSWRMNGGRGIFCYYLIVPEVMYSHRWEDFDIRHENNEYNLPIGWRMVEDSFHGGVTFAERQLDNSLGKVISYAKVGCDYNHSFDRVYDIELRHVLAEGRKTVCDFYRAHSDFA